MISGYILFLNIFYIPAIPTYLMSDFVISDILIFRKKRLKKILFEFKLFAYKPTVILAYTFIVLYNGQNIE